MTCAPRGHFVRDPIESRNDPELQSRGAPKTHQSPTLGISVATAAPFRHCVAEIKRGRRLPRWTCP